MKNENIDYKEVAKQLRKPNGEFGKIVAGKMNEGNKILTDLTYNSVNKFEGKYVLEIGFGNGYFLPKLIINNCEKIYGIDYSELMVEEASIILKSFIENKTIELKLASSDSIPYQDNYFDKICTINTIYFWDEPINIIKEIKRVLKSGGIFSIGFRSKERIKILEFTKYGFSLYSIADVVKLFEDFNFQLIESLVEDEIIYDAVCLTFRNI